MAVFVSYARKDQALVDHLVRDIERARREVWFDQDVTGGQAWWDTILAEIRGCQLFVFALSPDSLESRACTAELRYALALRRPVLPVMVRTVAVQLTPPEVANAHIVDYRERTADAAFALANALAPASTAPPLPDPLPEPPPVPISYLYSVRVLLESDVLTHRQQQEVLDELTEHLDDEDDRAVALVLLAQLRRRPDVTERIGRALDELLASGPRAAPHPRPQPRRRPRSWRPVAGVVAATAVLSAVGLWAVTRGDGDDDEVAGAEDGPVPVAVVRTLEVGVDPADLEVVDGDLWVASGQGPVRRVDLATGTTEVVAQLAPGGSNVMLADGDDVAVSQFPIARVAYLTPSAGEPALAELAGGQPLNGAAGPDGLWFSVHLSEGGAVARLEDRVEVERHGVPFRPYGVAHDGDRVYVTFLDDRAVGRVDLATGEVATGPVEGAPVDVAVVDGALWATLQDRGRVAVLDPETLVVTAEHPVGERPWKLVAGLDSVWVTNQGSGAPGSVSRLDPDTGARLQPDVTVGLAPDEVSIVGDRVYVANRGDGTVTELAG